MLDLRSARVRGPFHHKLIAFLLERMAADRGITQESLADAVDMHQTTVSGILKKGKGTFDMDEADAVLRHVGSSLKTFLTDAAHVPAPKRIERPLLAQLHRVLIRVPDDGLAVVLATARSVKARSVRGAGKQSARRHVADRASKVRKTGGTR